MVRQSFVKLLSEWFSVVIIFSDDYKSLNMHMRTVYCPYNIRYTMQSFKLLAKTLNCDSSAICMKTDCKYFLKTLQNSLSISDNVLWWTPYKSPILCGPLPLPNLCNDIGTISYTGTIFLNRVSFFLKYGPISHTKIWKYYTSVEFVS